MSMKKGQVLLLWVLVCPGVTGAIEPVCTASAVAVGYLIGNLPSYQDILCYFHECCQPEWISFNQTGNTFSICSSIYVYLQSLFLHNYLSFLRWRVSASVVQYPNIYQKSIIETALDFWRAGRDREEIEVSDLEASLSVSIFNNENSGFYRSSLIKDNLVDFFVPFLPLEYSHVVQCIMAEMKIRASEENGKPNLDVANKVARELQYFPKTERAFSISGCKTIQKKLNFYT
uniref:Torsin family 1 n=1 Tax=Oryzias melastigma TaxID=30732 RepID=A0A3B3C2Z5_ORYME